MSSLSTPRPSETPQRAILRRIAQQAMAERGLPPTFSNAVAAELDRIQEPGHEKPASASPPIRDLTGLLWASIDNDDSRDLDQLSVADATRGDVITVLVAIADVDTLVKSGSAIDEHARHNTTSVYTAGGVFPMLPEQLSTDLTSLNPDRDRLALVIEMVVDADGAVQRSDIYRARVRNRAQLVYGSVGAWLEGTASMPAAVAAVPGLAENLRQQDEVARRLRNVRHAHGALSLETARAKPHFEGNQLRALDVEQKNRAADLIEDFMIAANGVAARYLSAKGFPSIRRVVRTPKRWERIRALAAERGTQLPVDADSVALDRWLVQQRATDPTNFAELSLSVIKLLGAGEYVAQQPGAEPIGHFGLAVRDYAHSTAPNRRYADLITQRLLKAAIAGDTPPQDDFAALAAHLTEGEDAANKVERQVGKSAAAMLLQSRIHERFDAQVTGVSPKGTWARLLTMPVEGRVVRQAEGVEVGERIRVQLVAVDVERGFIDFARMT
jgi:exoribonuclease-2